MNYNTKICYPIQWKIELKKQANITKKSIKQVVTRKNQLNYLKKLK